MVELNAGGFDEPLPRVSPLSDYALQAGAYDRGRHLQPDVMDAHRGMLRLVVGDMPVRLALDVGSGTGRFSAALSEWLSCPVVALEPNPAMRAVARQVGAEGVSHLPGRAEGIPLPEASVDVAFMADVVHHVDLNRAARELARVVKPSGVLVLPTGLPELVERFMEQPYFPEAAEVAQARMYSERQIVNELSKAGFTYIGRQDHRAPLVGGLQELRDRVALRTFTALQMIPEDAFNAGLARIDARLAQEPLAGHFVYSQMLCFARNADSARV